MTVLYRLALPESKAGPEMEIRRSAHCFSGAAASQHVLHARYSLACCILGAFASAVVAERALPVHLFSYAGVHIRSVLLLSVSIHMHSALCCIPHHAMLHRPPCCFT